MTNVTKTNKTTETKTVNTITIFGDEFENRKYELKEVIAFTRKRFETKGSQSELPVGQMSYYILAFRHLKLVEVSYETIAQIVRKIFELNGQLCETTAKAQAWYQRKIKNGSIDITKDFKPSTRTKQIVDISTFF